MSNETDLGFAAQHTLRHHPLLATARAYGENRNAFESFVRGFIEDLQPVGATEMILAARAAGLAWRLNRAQGLETQILSTPDSVHGRTALQDGLVRRASREAIDIVSRWEQALERSLVKCLTLIERLQRTRNLRRDTTQMSALQPVSASIGGESTAECGVTVVPATVVPLAGTAV